MFTGIVTDIGEVLSVERLAEGLSRLTVRCAYAPGKDPLSGMIHFVRELSRQHTVFIQQTVR